MSRCQLIRTRLALQLGQIASRLGEVNDDGLRESVGPEEEGLGDDLGISGAKSTLDLIWQYGRGSLNC